MRVMEGQFVSVLPFKDMNINNLSLQCKCRFITIKEMEDKRYQFFMEPRCLKHLLKYAEWKMANTAVSMKGLKLNYKYNIHRDGSSEAIN